MFFGFTGTYTLDLTIPETPLNRLSSSTTKRDINCDLFLYPSAPVSQWVSFEEEPYAIIKSQVEHLYPTNIYHKTTNTIAGNPQQQEANSFDVIPAQNSTRYQFITYNPFPNYGIRYNSVGDRTITFKISNPDYVYGMVIGIGSNQYVVASNGVDDPITDGYITDLWKFRNLKALSIKPSRNSFIKGVGILPENLEQLSMMGLSGLLEFPALPTTLKYFHVGAINTSFSIAPVLNTIENCTNLKILSLGNDSGFPNTIIGMGFLSNGEILDLTNHSQLREVFIHGNNATAPGIDVKLPTHDLGAVSFQYNKALNVDQAPTLRALLKPENNFIRMFFIGDCTNFNPTWNITSADVKDSLITQFGFANTPIGGTIDFSIECPTIEQFYTTRAGSGVGTNLTSIKLSGLTNTNLIRANGNSLLEYLELPLPTIKKLSTLSINDNPLLSTANNPNLKAAIEGNTELLSLFAHNIDSLGVDLNLSAHTKLVNLNIGNSGLEGTLTLPASRVANGITQLHLHQNPNLTAVENVGVHNLITVVNNYLNNVDLDYSLLPNVLTIQNQSNSGQTYIDLSNINTTTLKPTVNFSSCPNLKLITFPSNETYYKLNNNVDLIIHSCPQLTGLTNLEYVNYNSLSGSLSHDFNAYNCALDITFPFGVIGFCPRSITIQNNGMSVINVNATINNLYTNKTKWNNYTIVKTINIGGTNSHASGIYQAPSGFTLNTNDGTPVSAAEQIYVLVNNYGWTITFNAEVIAGIHWSSVSGSYNALWSSVAYGNDTFVAVAKSGGGNRVMYSIDSGNTWTMTSSATNYWMWVTYGNGLFVAVGADGSNRVMTSPDGINWTSRTSAGEFNQWNSVTYGGGLFVAVSRTGFGNRVMTSPDGINWTSRTSAADNNWNSVTYGNGLFVAVSDSGSGNRVMTSPDGINWTSRTSAADNAWQGVTYGNGLFVAVSSTGTANRVMTSPDGINWTSRTTPVDNSWKSVAYGNDMFVAVSNTGTATNRVMTSVDGITWVSRTSAGSTNNEWQGITYGNGQFIAVSHASSNWIMKSP